MTEQLYILLSNPIVLGIAGIMFLIGFISGFLYAVRGSSVIKKSDFFATLVFLIWILLNIYAFFQQTEISAYFDIIGIMAASHLIGEGFAKGLIEILNTGSITIGKK